MRQIPDLCRKMLKAKADSVKSLNVLIVGIPNVGKSSLINILAERSIAKTGNEPAVTKRQQRIQIADNIVLSDTPGVLWSKVENENSGYRLAVTGAIKDTAMEYDDVAMFAGAYLLSTYPDRLMDRYQLENQPESELELLQAIGRKRGCLGPRGRVDLNKVGKILLSELRDGQLGQISLETPTIIKAELEQLAIIMAQKAELKTARKNRWKNN
jgi:ribosome biogenesis GTPase A